MSAKGLVAFTFLQCRYKSYENDFYINGKIFTGKKDFNKQRNGFCFFYVIPKKYNLLKEYIILSRNEGIG